MIVALRKKRGRVYGPDSNGIMMTPREFDRAKFFEGSRYELINGVLVVSPPPLESQRDPNDERAFWIRAYQYQHSQGGCVDKTLPEQTINTGKNRRNADRVIWIGPGRRPRRRDTPSVAIEIVSEGKRNIERDYEAKRSEYMHCGVKEYWILDRFEHTLTVYFASGRRPRKRVFPAGDVYTTDLLPGFQLPLAPLFDLADSWEDAE